MSTKRSPFLRYLPMVLFLVLYGVIMFEFKLFIAVLPNIEPVTVMVIALTAALGPWAFVSVYVYVFCELVIFGIGIWNIMYIYVWAILALVVWALSVPMSALDNRFKRKGFVMTGVFIIVAALFGILFGTLCSIPYIFVFGIESAIAWIASGIAFDVMHCVGNAVMTAVLFYPIYWLLQKSKTFLIRA